MNPSQPIGANAKNGVSQANASQANGSSESFQEFKLVSAGPGIPQHHIMKMPHANFDLDTLDKPLKMYRRNPWKERKEKWLAQQEAQRELLIAQGVDPATLPPPGEKVVLPGTKNANVDTSKIAPFGAAHQKKQNLFKKKIKTFYLGHEDGEDDSNLAVEEGEGAGPSTTIASIYSRYGDPDRQPWVLEDAQNTKYHGSLEGAQNSSYVLLVSSGPGQFTVIPASKWYKFVHKPNHRTLTADEAEEQLRARKAGRAMGSSDRWLMKNIAEKDVPMQSVSSSSTSAKPMKAWKAKLLGLDDSEEKSKPRRKPRRKEEDEPEGLDYDEEFADDEVVELGIEDKDEAKEASARLYGRAGRKAQFDSDDDSDLEPVSTVSTKIGKKIAKSLRKIEKNDAYEDLEEENPYLSEEEEEEEDETIDKNQLTATTDSAQASPSSNNKLSSSQKLLSMKRKKNGTGSSTLTSRNASPSLDSPRATSPSLRQSSVGPDLAAVASKSDAKRKRYEVDESQGDKKTRQGSPPPPPTAAEVVARIEKKRKGIKGRAISASPPPVSGTPQSIGSPSPPPETASGAELVLTEDDVVNAISPDNGTITVKQLVTKLQHFFKADVKNKTILKEILRKLVDHDKATGKLTLKP